MPQQKPSATGHAETLKSQDKDGDERLRFRDDLAAAVKAALAKQEPDPRTRFHEQFRKEADEYDRDLHKKYHDDFNSTLIFAGLFSAVASAFIVDVQSQMRPDYDQMSFTVLTMLINTTSGKPPQLPIPTFPGPSPSIVQVQSILFASLLSALLAAFLAMLGKQWLNFHLEGSFIDRNRQREQKMRGMITWRFKLVVEFLPLSLQVSLLLLGWALARYLWDVSHIVSFVIIGFTAAGIFLYILIILAGTFSKTCPFQTPISVGIRAIFEFNRKEIEGFFEVVRNTFRPTRSPERLVVHREQLLTPTIASDIDDQDSAFRAELRCILTMFRMTKAPDSVEAIMAYITEIVWGDRFKSVPLLQVHQTLRESLLRSTNGKVYPRPGSRDKALWSAKALLHLCNQRRCTYPLDPILPIQVKLIEQPLGNHGFDHDPDLQSTFYIVDWTLGGTGPDIPWSNLQLSSHHHCWLARTLQYRAWDSLRRQQRLTPDVRGFVGASLSSSGSPTRVVADCLFIVHMVIGHHPTLDDLLTRDRSEKITEIIDGIFDRLDDIFGRSAPVDTRSAIEALELAINLQDRRVCARSYSLFRTIVNKADQRIELWSPARLCLQGAYSATMAEVPPVGDPRQLLNFLRYHMEERAIIGSHPIYHVFSALAVASDEETDRGLATHDFTDSLLIDTTIEALEDKAFTLLRRSATLVLVKLDKHLFTTDEAFKSGNKASRFVAAWSSAIGEFLKDVAPTNSHQIERAAVNVFLAIVHLPCLRVHLPRERWALIQHFPHLMFTDPPSLRRCLKDPEILPFLKKGTMGYGPPLNWLGMLWIMYDRLSPEVREQLEQGTRHVAEGEYFYHLTSYSNLLDVYLSGLATRIGKLDQLDQAAYHLEQAKRERALEAKDRLNRIRNTAKRKSLFS